MNSRRQPYNLVFVFLLLSITSVIEVDRDRHLLRTSPKTVDVAAVLLREERGVRHCAPEGLISWSIIKHPAMTSQLRPYQACASVPMVVTMEL